jgi:hypothetical protein
MRHNSRYSLARLFCWRQFWLKSAFLHILIESVYETCAVFVTMVHSGVKQKRKCRYTLWICIGRCSRAMRQTWRRKLLFSISDVRVPTATVILYFNVSTTSVRLVTPWTAVDLRRTYLHNKLWRYMSKKLLCTLSLLSQHSSIFHLEQQS